MVSSWLVSHCLLLGLVVIQAREESFIKLLGPVNIGNTPLVWNGKLNDPKSIEFKKFQDELCKNSQELISSMPELAGTRFNCTVYPVESEVGDLVGCTLSSHTLTNLDTTSLKSALAQRLEQMSNLQGAHFVDIMGVSVSASASSSSMMFSHDEMHEPHDIYLYDSGF